MQATLKNLEITLGTLKESDPYGVLVIQPGAYYEVKGKLLNTKIYLYDIFHNIDYIKMKYYTRYSPSCNLDDVVVLRTFNFIKSLRFHNRGDVEGFISDLIKSDKETFDADASSVERYLEFLIQMVLCIPLGF